MKIYIICLHLCVDISVYAYTAELVCPSGRATQNEPPRCCKKHAFIQREHGLSFKNKIQATNQNI